jgi:copper chaperone CopZ
VKVIARRLFRFPSASVVSSNNTASVIAVDGLVCDVCASRVRRSLGRVPEVRSAEVDLETGIVTVSHDRTVSTRQLTHAAERPVILRPLRRALAWRPKLAFEART